MTPDICIHAMARSSKMIFCSIVSHDSGWTVSWPRGHYLVQHQHHSPCNSRASGLNATVGDAPANNLNLFQFISRRQVLRLPVGVEYGSMTARREKASLQGIEIHRTKSNPVFDKVWLIVVEL